MAIIGPQRHLFDIPEEVAYFNCAYNAPQLIASQARLVQGVRSKNHPWRRTSASFFEDAETVRTLCSRLFGGEVDAYAVVPAASYGISTAARILEPRLSRGDEIVVIAEEFPSVVLPFRRVAEVTGAAIVTIAAPDDGDWAGAIVQRLNARTRVVALSSCHWTNGAYIDLEAVGAACRSVDAALVVDATQTLGAMPLALERVTPDFLVAAGYKWLLCPYGFGVLRVAPRWREARPLEEVWLARANAQDFTSIMDYSDVYQPGARRFDAGEKCTPTILPGAIAALEQIEAWSIGNIAESLAAINARIVAGLERLGFRVRPASQRCPHVFGARLPGAGGDDLVAALRSRQVYISRRGQELRFAPHLHINDRDIDRLLDGLSALISP